MTDSDSDSDSSASSASTETAKALKGQECAENYAEEQINLFGEGHLSAYKLCTICYWGRGAGLVCTLNELAMPPGLQTGKYSDRCKTVLGFDNDSRKLQKLTVPAGNKYDSSRKKTDIWVCPPHESMHTEIAESEYSITDKVADSISGQEWTPIYTSHIVVRNNPNRTVHPYALYVDGAPFTKKDGFIGFFYYHLAENRRHLAVLLRKSSLCKCGCKGWCTFHVVLSFLDYCHVALAQNTFPKERFGGGSWLSPSDDSRASDAGMPMLLVGALIYIKADWAEFATTFAFASWSSNTNPCFCCDADKSWMHSIYDEVDADDGPFTEKTHVEYLDACARCEIWVTIPDIQTYRSLRSKLYLDKRKSAGYSGRCLLKDGFPEFDLVRGDRLEPNADMIEYSVFDDYATNFPDGGLRALFWRRSLETTTRHRNPIFNESIGVVSTLLSIDALHTLNLGVYKDYCMHVFWKLLQRNVFELPGSAEDRHQLGIGRLKTCIFAHYTTLSEEERQHVTQIQDLTEKMLGKQSKKALETKAAETKGLIPFCLKMCTKFEEKLGIVGRMLREVGEHLLAFQSIMDSHGRVLDRLQRVDPLGVTSSVYRLCTISLSPSPSIYIYIYICVDI